MTSDQDPHIPLLTALAAAEPNAHAVITCIQRDAPMAVYDPEAWELIGQCLRPGAHALVVTQEDNYAAIACAAQAGGFDIRDCIMWLYDDLGEIGVVPVLVARKPLIGTVAKNMVLHETGGINIDACRIAIRDDDPGKKNYHTNRATFQHYEVKNSLYDIGVKSVCTSEHPGGRWPCNLAHDGSKLLMDEFARYGVKTSGKMKAGTAKKGGKGSCYGEFKAQPTVNDTIGDSGLVSRFYHELRWYDLIHHLFKLIEVPDAIVLDPFMGHGHVARVAAERGVTGIGLHD